MKSPAASRQAERSRPGSRSPKEARAGGGDAGGGGGRLPPGPVKWSRDRMQGQRGACGALVIPDDRWEPCHLEQGHQAEQGPCRGCSSAGWARQGWGLGWQLGQGCSHSWPLWLAPNPHFISSFHLPGYPEPQVFLVEGPAVNPRGGELPSAQTTAP